MAYNIGFIGGGNMSTAIFTGILKNESHPASKIWVSGPRLSSLQHWQDSGANVSTDNGEILSKCSIVFLGVKPAMLDSAIEGCKSSGNISKEGVLFVSMLAGMSIEKIHKKLETVAKSPRVIRIMPNTPIMVGAGACLYTPDSFATKEDCSNIEKLISGSSMCECIPENMIDSLGALTACGPAFMYIVIEALADGAVKQGVPRATALRFASQMVSGSAQMVLQTGRHPGLLKDEVCSAGGSTICGVAAIENGGVRASMINAIEAAVQRTKEMGKQN